VSEIFLPKIIKIC